jgi:hypothetical protein
MSISQVVLLIMATLVSGFAIVTLVAEFLPVIREAWSQTGRLTQSGDSSLSRSSINWLAATAAGGAVLLGAVLV